MHTYKYNIIEVAKTLAFVRIYDNSERACFGYILACIYKVEKL